MAIPDKAITRGEQYLAVMAGQSGTLPDEPITRKEHYLAKAAGQEVETPEPITREEMYLNAIAEGGGGGGGVTVTPLSITENGTYTAPSGTAYSPVTVDVAGGITSELPSGYTQLRYVASSGTQIINTGVTPTLDTKVQAQFYKTATGGGYMFPTGCANPVIGVAASNTMSYTGGLCSFGNITDKTLSGPLACDIVPIYTVSKTEATGKTYEGYATTQVSINATSLGNVNPDTRIGIFGRYNGAKAERFSHIRLFREKIWDGETLLRDFVPAMENDTEEVGLYDIVNNVFYRNVGSGVLIGGV